MTVPTAMLAVVALLLGVAVALLWLRRRPAQGDLVATLRAELDEQRRLLEEQREQSVHAAIQSVVTITSEQLGQQLAAGAVQLDHRNELVGERLTAMDQQLEQVRELVGVLERRRAQSMGELTERLETTGRVTLELSKTTDALRQALASPSSRGQWGERMADDVLRAAGFVHGVNYHKQTSTKSGRPDFTFPLPGDRVVHMDVKFPLDNYLKFLEATVDTERDRCLKDFRRDVRNRVKELSKRDYIDVSEGTLDQVLLFLPNEQLYGFIHEHDPELLDHALAHKVVLCSPLTLFAVLAVIRQAVDDHVMHIRSGEILEVLQSFQKQWDKFGGHLDMLGDRLEKTQKAFHEVNGVRRRQLERQLDRVEELRKTTDTPGDAAVLSLPEREAAAG